MSILQFIASIFSSVMWPLSIIIIILILKKPLTHMILSLNNLTYKDWQVSFGKEVAKLESVADRVKIPAIITEKIGDETNNKSQYVHDDIDTASLQEKAEVLEVRLRELEKGSLQKSDHEKDIREEIQKVLLELLPQKDSFDEKIESLARVDPRSAVVEAAYQLEQEIDLALGRLNLAPSRSGKYRDVNVFLANNYIEAETAKIWREMRELRNRAVHGHEEITYDEAIDYAQLAKRMMQKFASLHK